MDRALPRGCWLLPGPVASLWSRHSILEKGISSRKYRKEKGFTRNALTLKIENPLILFLTFTLQVLDFFFLGGVSFCLFRAALKAYGGFRARGLIRAVVLAYATATATPELSQVCDLHHSSQQRRTLDQLSEARDRTCNLTVPSRIRFCCATMGTPVLDHLSGRISVCVYIYF